VVRHVQVEVGDMTSGVSEEGRQIIKRAMDLAAARNERLTTLHLLLALSEAGGLAAELLTRNAVGAAGIRPLLKARHPEAPTTMDRLTRSAGDLAERLPGRRQAGSLHLLAALASVPDTLAFRSLGLIGCNTSTLVGQILGILTGTGRRTIHVEAGRGDIAEGPPDIQRRPAEPPAEPPPRARAPRPRIPAAQPPPLSRNPWTLDPKRFAVLAGSSINLNELASRGKLDPLIGRRAELESIMDILGKRRANSPCLTGEHGVGKTAIVEGLASMIVRDQVPDRFRGRILVKLGVTGLVGGTGVRGALGERLLTLRDEVERAGGRIILFLDDVHELLRAADSGGEGVVHELKEAMEHGALPCVCTTTTAEWKKIAETYPGLARCLTQVAVEEPDEHETLRIVGILSEKYASFHGVSIEDGAIHAAVTLASRYMAARRNPEKALTVLDLASARASRTQGKVLDREEVAVVVAETVGIPRERLSETDTSKLLSLEQELARRIVGHPEAIGIVSHTMRRNAAGFRGRRPIGSFLFLGPTGVGKTEMSKAMAEIIFERPSSFVRFDMSEFSEAHSVSRLVGAPPGYVGFDRGGELTGALMESPYKLVLFDEFEKAHPAVHRLLLQVLDDGRLTDAMGRTVDFSNTVVVLTSNMGSNVKPQARTGFAPVADGDRFRDYREKVLAVVRDVLPPELFNRIDEPIVFSPLTEDEVREIARRLLATSAASLEEARDVGLSWDESLIDHLIRAGGYDASLGARPMKRTIQKVVEARVAELILSGRVGAGGTVRITVDGDAGPRFRTSASRAGGRSRARAKEKPSGAKKRGRQGKRAA
jgi:ATP-dependent Clp protease ATP-binding subunit ClpC